MVLSNKLKKNSNIGLKKRNTKKRIERIKKIVRKTKKAKKPKKPKKLKKSKKYVVPVGMAKGIEEDRERSKNILLDELENYGIWQLDSIENVLDRKSNHLSIGQNIGAASNRGLTQYGDEPDGYDHDYAFRLDLEDLPEFHTLVDRIIQFNPNIVKVDIFVSELEKFPRKILQLQNLNELTIRKGNIKSIPSLQSLTGLKNISLIDLPNLSSLPTDLGYIPDLEYIYLEKLLNINHLPNSLRHAENLKYLNIRRCPKIKEVSEDILTLPGLRNVNLNDKSITLSKTKLKKTETRNNTRPLKSTRGHVLSPSNWE